MEEGEAEEMSRVQKMRPNVLEDIHPYKEKLMRKISLFGVFIFCDTTTRFLFRSGGHEDQMMHAPKREANAIENTMHNYLFQNLPNYNSLILTKIIIRNLIL